MPAGRDGSDRGKEIATVLAKAGWRWPTRNRRGFDPDSVRIDWKVN
jgi:hypothetical protein